MKTWKKIEDTRKRTNEIVSLKNRNEERIQKVRFLSLLTPVENIRLLTSKRTAALSVDLELYGKQATTRRKEESSGSDLPLEEGGGEADKDNKGLERVEAAPLGVQNRNREQDEEPNRKPAEASCPNEGRGGTQAKDHDGLTQPSR